MAFAAAPFQAEANGIIARCVITPTSTNRATVEATQTRKADGLPIDWGPENVFVARVVNDAGTVVEYDLFNVPGIGSIVNKGPQTLNVRSFLAQLEGGDEGARVNYIWHPPAG